MYRNEDPTYENEDPTFLMSGPMFLERGAPVTSGSNGGRARAAVAVSTGSDPQVQKNKVRLTRARIIRNNSLFGG